MASNEAVPVRIPPLGLGAIPCVLGAWLVRKGQSVVAGDRLVEVLAGDVLTDISAPVTGTLVTKELQEDQEVHTGQVVAWIRPSTAFDGSRGLAD